MALLAYRTCWTVWMVRVRVLLVRAATEPSEPWWTDAAGLGPMGRWPPLLFPQVSSIRVQGVKLQNRSRNQRLAVVLVQNRTRIWTTQDPTHSWFRLNWQLNSSEPIREQNLQPPELQLQNQAGNELRSKPHPGRTAPCRFGTLTSQPYQTGLTCSG